MTNRLRPLVSHEAWLLVAVSFLLCACDPRARGDSAIALQGANTGLDVDPVSAQPAASPPQRFVPGEFLVKFKAGVSKESATSVLSKASIRETRIIRSVPGLRVVRVATDENATELFKAQVAADPRIEYVEPNFIYHTMSAPNDPDYPRLWAMHNTNQTGSTLPYFPDIGAEAAWDITTGDDNIVVAVIDSGVDYNHEDLAANIWRNTADCDGDGIDDDGDGYVDDCHGIDTVDHDSDPMDVAEHGTHVSGTIGAVGNNGVGIAGVAWHVKIMPCRFIDANGNGTTAAAVECLDYVAAMKDRGVDVIATNNSWGSYENSRALEDAIRAQRDRGILFVAAAGNDIQQDDDRIPVYPCVHEVANVICVESAYDSVDIFSNFGRGTVLLGAPGTSIYSTMPGNRYDWLDGTSMATPHVVGALVLLAAQDPTRTPWQLRNLVASGTELPHQYATPSVTEGRLNVYNSLTCTNRTVLGRMRPAIFDPLSRAPGDPVTIRALHVRCAAPAGNVDVSVAPSGEIVTLRDDGAAPDEIAGDGIYAGQWIAHGEGTYTFAFPTPETEQFTVEVDPFIKSGFPLRTATHTFDNQEIATGGAPLAVGNVTGDAKLEILSLAPAFGPLLAWDSQGRPIPGWPQYESALSGGLALGNFDADPAHCEVVAAYGGLRLFRGDGSRVTGWPRPDASLLSASPVADLDHDGIDEILALPARRADGSLFSADVQVPAFTTAADATAYGVVAGDLDADGEPEMVGLSRSSATGYSLWVSDRHGIEPGFPVAIPGGNDTVGATLPRIGDVDGDGAPDIVLGSANYPNSRDQVQIFDAHGRLRRTLYSANFANDEVVLADLDRDGIPEIVKVGRRFIDVWRGNGVPFSGWPVDVTNALGVAPAIGDIDGDGAVDIVTVGFEGPIGAIDGTLTLQASHADGTRLAGFPRRIKGRLGGASPPAIADLDLDGRNDLVVSYGRGLGLKETIFAYDLRGAGPYGPVEWSEQSGDSRRSGYYETGKNLPGQAYVATQVFGAGRITAAGGGIDCRGDCMQRYAKGTNVTLTAMATAGGRFDRWRGACAAQGNPCTLAVTRLTETSADFTSLVTVGLAGSGAGSVSSDIAGINCGTDCSESYPARTYLTLSANAAGGSAFESWQGACSGTRPTCAVFVDDAKAVTARFTNRHTLTVNRIGSGAAAITSNPEGLTCSGSICTGEFVPGSTVDVTVTPDAGSYYSSVEYPYCNTFVQPCRVTMNGAQTMRVYVERKPVVTMTIVGSGRVRSSPAGLDCRSTCSAPLDVGGATFEAAADPGWHLARWEGSCANRGVCNVYLAHDLAVTAVFEQDPTLTINFSGTGSGTVEAGGVVSCATSCAQRLSIPRLLTFNATPAPNSTFAGWTGACSGTSPTCQTTFDADQTVGVTFTRNPSSGASSSSGGSAGSGGGGGRFGWLELMMLALLLCASSAERLVERLRRLREPDRFLRAHVQAILEPHAELPG